LAPQEQPVALAGLGQEELPAERRLRTALLRRGTEPASAVRMLPAEFLRRTALRKTMAELMPAERPMAAGSQTQALAELDLAEMPPRTELALPHNRVRQARRGLTVRCRGQICRAL